MSKRSKAIVVLLAIVMFCVLYGVVSPGQFFSGIQKLFMSLTTDQKLVLIGAFSVLFGTIFGGFMTFQGGKKSGESVFNAQEKKAQREASEKKDLEDLTNAIDNYKKRLLWELQEKEYPILGARKYKLHLEVFRNVVFRGRSLERDVQPRLAEETLEERYDPIQRILLAQHKFERSKGNEVKELKTFIKLNNGPVHRNVYRLSGGPGTGKSLYLTIMALNAVSGSEKLDDIVLPIFISLKDFARKSLLGKENLLNFIVDTLVENKNYQFPEKKTRSYIKDKLNKGQVLLLLDGADEMPEHHWFMDRFPFMRKQENVSSTISSHDEVMRFIDKQLGPIYKKSLVIITTRDRTQYRMTSNDLIMEDLMPEDIRLLMKNLKTNAARSSSVAAANMAEIALLLEQFPRLRAFASIPLALLHMLSISTLPEYSLPRQRVELYQSYIDALLNDWNAEKDILPGHLGRFLRQKRTIIHSPIVDKDKKLHLLGFLAWKLHSQHRCTFTRDELFSYIDEEKCPLFTSSKAHPLSVVFSSKEKEKLIFKELVFKELVFKNGLLRENAKVEGIYEFSSITLQEYFTARYVFEHQNEPLHVPQSSQLSSQVPQPSLLEELYSHRGSLWWEEVLALYIQYALQQTTTQTQQLQKFHERIKALAGIPADNDPNTKKWPPDPSQDYYSDLLLAGKGLVQQHTTQGSQNHDLMKLQKETYLRLYGLLMSSGLTSSTPLFVQQQISSILLEKYCKDVNKDNLDFFLHPSPVPGEYDAVVQDLQVICNFMGGDEIVPSLLLPFFKENENGIRQLLLNFKTVTDDDITKKIIDPTIPDAMKKQIIHVLCIQRRVSISSVMYTIITMQTGVSMEIRKCAATAIGILGNESYIELLFALLKSNVTIPVEKEIQWNIINALGIFIQRGYYSKVIKNLAKCLDYTNPDYMKEEYLRLNVASILLPEKDNDDSSYFELSPISFANEITSALAMVLVDGSESNIKNVFSLLLHSSGIENREKIWICELLERVCEKKDYIEQLKQLLKPLKQKLGSTRNLEFEKELEEALDRTQWIVIRRENSVNDAQQNGSQARVGVI